MNGASVLYSRTASSHPKQHYRSLLLNFFGKRHLSVTALQNIRYMRRYGFKIDFYSVYGNCDGASSSVVAQKNESYRT